MKHGFMIKASTSKCSASRSTDFSIFVALQFTFGTEITVY